MGPSGVQCIVVFTVHCTVHSVHHFTQVQCKVPTPPPLLPSRGSTCSRSPQVRARPQIWGRWLPGTTGSNLSKPGSGQDNQPGRMLFSLSVTVTTSAMCPGVLHEPRALPRPGLYLGTVRNVTSLCNGDQGSMKLFTWLFRH